MINKLRELNDKGRYDLELSYYYNKGISFEDYIERLRDGINENEVIYYNKAMKFLSEEDNSLTEAMELATEYGYTTENINSELLATLLLQYRMNEQLSELYNDIENAFNKYIKL
jgi:hypothetical protein